MRHTLVLALVAFGATAPGAMAQDGYSYAAPGSFAWTGSYLGLEAGGGWLSTSLTGGAANNYSGNGWAGGAFAGYNFQATQNVLWGVELSLHANNATGTDGGVGGSTDTTKTRWDSTLNARVGAPFGPALAYVTGGLALAGVTQTNSGGSISGPATLVGWNVGAGVDVALTDKLFGRVGAKYKSYGGASYAGSSVPSFKATTSSTEVTIGLGMKLN